MKAQLFKKWFLSLFFIALITALILYNFLPYFFESVSLFLSLSAAEVVADQLATLITASSVAPFYIEITYAPSKEIKYDVSAKNRRLEVKPYYNSPVTRDITKYAFYGVNLPDFSFEKVNIFSITKIVENSKSIYSISASSSD